MCGGTDQKMIIQAACAIEITHAYILVLDDIMDKSMKRRGGASAHMLLADYHASRGLSGDSYHFGEAVAINGALIGNHYAQKLVTELAVDDRYKLKALALLNDALMVTGHGQINDLFNEVLDTIDGAAVDNVLVWKTAHYSFLNPLQFGMALAGADQVSLDGIAPYCMHAGRAFQITDDILGTFGSEQEAGKSPMDDIREGKRTLLTLNGLQKASSADKNFLIQMLGNERLTQVEFSRCKEILVATGALESAQEEAAKHIAEAKTSLEVSAHLWSRAGTDFLSALVGQLLGRTA
jgi:geranylgeranyl diphosphate synthase type I